LPQFGFIIILFLSVLSVKRYFAAFAGLFCTTLSVSPLWAHPGHGEAGASHYFAAPEHLLPVVVVVAILLCTVGLLLGGRIANFIANR